MAVAVTLRLEAPLLVPKECKALQSLDLGYLFTRSMNLIRPYLKTESFEDMSFEMRTSAVSLISSASSSFPISSFLLRVDCCCCDESRAEDCEFAGKRVTSMSTMEYSLVV